MDKPKKLILDYSKWRSGVNGENKVGEGKTQLQNMEGFQCCLGQWSIQLGVTEEEALGCDEPNELHTLVSLFCDESYYYGRNESCYKTTNELAVDCIAINDDDGTTPEEKIEKLMERLQEEGIELEVINKP